MVTQGISDNNRQFEAAIARGDAAGCASVYTDDGKVMAPDTPMITGKDAIRGYWQAILDMGVKGVSLRTLDLDELGDTAVERGGGHSGYSNGRRRDGAGRGQIRGRLEASGRRVVEVGHRLL